MDPATVYVLLANGHLLIVKLPLAQTNELTLTATSPEEQSTTHALALSRDGALLYAAVADASLNGRIVEVETATQHVVREIALDAGASPRGLVVGQRAGNLYAFGNKPGSALVWIIDPSARTPPRSFVARRADGHNDLVFEGLVNADESALFLSYHGADTTGIDRFALSDDTLERCISDALPGHGCFNAHGGMALADDHLLATTGEGPLLAIDPKSGQTLARYDVQLPGNHTDDVALEPGGQRAFLIGSFGYSCGLSSVDLRSGRTSVLVPPSTADSRCGERVVVGRGARTLIVARALRPLAARDRAGKVLVLAEDGREVGQIVTSSEPIDVVVASAP